MESKEANSKDLKDLQTPSVTRANSMFNSRRVPGNPYLVGANVFCCQSKNIPNYYNHSNYLGGVSSSKPSSRLAKLSETSPKLSENLLPENSKKSV